MLFSALVFEVFKSLLARIVKEFGEVYMTRGSFQCFKTDFFDVLKHGSRSYLSRYWRKRRHISSMMDRLAVGRTWRTAMDESIGVLPIATDKSTRALPVATGETPPGSLVEHYFA